MNNHLKILVIAATFIWVGLILGISFMEAPLKFRAPDITLKLGLGIGQLVFGVMNKIEIVLAVGIVASLFFLKSVEWKLFFIPILILLIQTVYLLPFLSQRIDVILSGGTPPASQMHLLYIIIELIKLFSLLIAGILFTHKALLSNKISSSHH